MRQRHRARAQSRHPARLIPPPPAPRAGLLLGLALLTGLLTACSRAEPSAGDFSPTLQRIRAARRLVCGINGQLPGFSSLAPDGRYEGFDVDLCRAVAAALGDGIRLELQPLSLAESLTALASGEVDLLARNLSLTLSRDAGGGNGLSFAPVMVHDGGAVLVPRASGLRRLADLAGRSICVISGSTTELVLAARLGELRLPYTPLRFRSADDSFSAYLAGRCAAISSDRSGLAARRSRFPQPGLHVLLPEVLSREPLAPATAQADPAWTDQVRWVMHTLVEAEERGIRRRSLAASLTRARAEPRRSDLRRFLGLEGNLGASLGLPADFSLRVIRAVGNYGELFDRHLGQGSRLGLPRGPDALVRDGGLQQAPPFR
ncbi:MAG: amino acid ABC transporter substrate-binding protein [Synechococcus sp.]|nr:amino acid ABC transporter substrate-binding protein [Synechococcus sp.]